MKEPSKHKTLPPTFFLTLCTPASDTILVLGVGRHEHFRALLTKRLVLVVRSMGPLLLGLEDMWVHSVGISVAEGFGGVEVGGRAHFLPTVVARFAEDVVGAETDGTEL